MRLRKSRQREAILEVVRRTDTHPTAEWIYEQVRKKIPNISLGTIYRNLKLLADEDKIMELEINGGASRFDGNTEFHHHFACKQCGKILDVTLNEQMESQMIDSISKETGLKITNHFCEFAGICRECQA